GVHAMTKVAPHTPSGRTFYTHIHGRRVNYWPLGGGGLSLRSHFIDAVAWMEHRAACAIREQHPRISRALCARSIEATDKQAAGPPGPCRPVSPRLCHRRKAALETRNQIVRILEADMEAQRGAAGRPARRRAIGGAVEQNDEALEPAPGKSHAEELERIEECAHGRIANRFEHDAEQSRGSGEIPPPDRVPGIVLERGGHDAKHLPS